ncbi:hypothetical protein ABZT34_14575 [Streptomyces sp. NPDC005329]|uniref:hypothetical protein n=1 Tax=Streptomyces sp. NPDC005329 TaxID=3157034 RepID=UPI0033B82F38
MSIRQSMVLKPTLGLLCVPAQAEARDISRAGLATDDGWAAYGTGTTAGAAADDAHGYTVTDRAGPVRALDGGSERDLTADVGWTPTLHGKIDSAAVADREVARGAGAGRIP